MSLFFLLCKHANIQIEEKNYISSFSHDITPNLFLGDIIVSAGCVAHS